MTAPQPLPSTVKAPSVPKKPDGGGRASRFFARNGEVFMASAEGGYCLSWAECDRCLTHWRADAGREPWAQRMTETMAAELEAVMAEGARQINESRAA